MQRVRQVIIDGCAGGLQGLRKQLAAEYAAEATGFAVRAEPVVALRFQLQSALETVERTEDGLLDRRAGTPQRPCQVDGVLLASRSRCLRLLALRTLESRCRVAQYGGANQYRNDSAWGLALG